MGDRNRHGGHAAFFGFIACLCTGLTIAVSGSSAQPPEQKTLWVAADDAALAVDTTAGEIFFDFPIAGTAHASAVDPANSLVWLKVGQREVSAYDFGGQLQYSIELPEDVHSPTWLEVDPGTGAVWVADPSQIYRIDPENGVTFSQQQPPLSLDLIIGASVDPGRSRFWYATTHNRLVALAADGTELQTVDLDWRIGSIAYDSFLDRLWVAGHEQLARYNAEGEQTFLSATALSVETLAPDGQGGVWASSRNELQHVDQSGLIEFTLDPFPGLLESTQALAVDTETGDAWVASTSRLRHYTIDGSLDHTLPARTTDGTDHTVFGLALPRQIPIEVIIESPEAGALLNDNQPPVEIRVETPAETDAQDLSLTSNGDEILVACEQIDTGLYRCNPTDILPEGPNGLSAHVENNAGISFDSEPVEITVDTHPPEITITQPPPDLITNEPELNVAGSIDESAEVTLNGESLDLDAELQFSRTLTLAEGQNDLTFQATDAAGNVNATTRHPVLDTQPPGAPQTGLIDGGEAEDGQTTVTGEAGSVEPNAEVVITNNRTGASVTAQANEEGAFTAQIEGEPEDEFTIVARDAAGNASESGTITARGPNIPPDPAGVAPVLPATGSPPLAKRISFLYEGPDPIQQGVTPDTIEARRIAVLRGQVRNRAGDPIRGVRISILDHPELGWTRTQLDGGFDMAVNGGGILTVVYEKDGYLPVQRTVETQWNDWFHADDVVMIPLDEQVTTIDLTDDSQPFQVARGSVVEDSDGTRQATLLFPAGTVAEITLPDGSKQQLSQLDVRATEYTVGDSGPEAMPAKLPPTSAYTYAVELSVDQAREQGIKVAGKDVVFNQPVPFYVENFLDFPTGEVVPIGYYDNDKAAWTPYPDGRIIEVLSEENGLAVLDTTGGGDPATATELSELGITDAERARLAELYAPGATLWRATLTHLSTWDCNWSWRPPADAEPPNVALPSSARLADSDEDRECTGCTINPQSQSVGESVDIAGTPYTLHYQSSRASGYGSNSTIIPLTNENIPPNLQAIKLEIAIAGQREVHTVAAATNLSHTFTWNGRDAMGRKVFGSARAEVTINYIYPCIYVAGGGGGGGGGIATASFARAGNLANPIGTRSRCEGFGFPRTSIVTLHSPFKPQTAVANWSLSIEHVWNDRVNALLRGDGRQRFLSAYSIETVAGIGSPGFAGDGGPATAAELRSPLDVVTRPDGSLYIVDYSNHRIRRVTPDGIIETIAGTGTAGFSGDGGPATQARLFNPRGIAIGPDGSLYIADQGNRRVRRVTPDGVIDTVVGTGAGNSSGDGGPATEARLDSPRRVTVDGNGSLYIVDSFAKRVRQVTPDGIIDTIAGAGSVSGDGGPAIEAALEDPLGVAIGGDGNLYIAERDNHRIRRVTSDGIIDTAAGTGVSGFSGDNGPANDARLHSPMGVTIDAHGNLYIADTANNRVRRVKPNGLIDTIAGTGEEGFSGDGGPGTEANLNNPVGVAVSADGSVYIADQFNHRIRKLSTGHPHTANGDITVPSEDGSELYVFDPAGRHLRTEDSRTGEIVFSFARDSDGRLTSITDGDGNTTTIERDGDGKPIAIVAPHGQRTEFAVNNDGHLNLITAPTSDIWAMAYTTNGLLTQITDPNGHINTFSYDAYGRLTRDDDPEGGGWQLARTDLPDGFRIDMTSGEGRVHQFMVERSSEGDRLYTDKAPDGTQTERIYTASEDTTIEYADGTLLFTSGGPDPRFDMDAPVIEIRRVTVPSGLELLRQTDRDVALTDPADPLSLEDLTDTVTTNGRVETASYDADTRQWTFTSAQDRVVTLAVDGQSRPLTQSVTGLKPISMNYDTRGRLSTVSWGTGNEERLSTFEYYDTSMGAQAGYLRSLTGPLDRETGFTYDAAGRVTQQVLPNGRMVGYQYDANGNLVAITPPGRSAHVFEYDGLDQRTVYEPPELSGIDSITRYHYNLDRQLTSVEQPGGETVTFGYDAGGRLASRTMPVGVTSYAYDSATGQLASIDAPGGVSLAFSWDGFLPTGTSWSGPVSGSVTRNFDNNFWLIQESVNGTSVSFGYDDDGLLTQAGDLSVARDPDHGLVTGTTLSVVADSRSYNGFGELSGRDLQLSGTSTYQVDYARDKLGRIVEETETIAGETVTRAYTYDQAGRLIQVTRDGAVEHSYSYDANGNRIGYTGPGGNLTGTYDAQDRIESYGDATYTHTPDGRLQSKTTPAGTTTYDYDAAGNLRNVALADGTTIEYLIDGRDRRVGKKVDRTLVQGWLYRDQLNPVAELDGQGNVAARFVYADKPNVPAYMIKGGTTYRIVSDHLGSVRLVINTDTRAIVQRMDYSPFGRVITDTNPGFQPFGFAGGLYDPDTGLVRFGARDYDPETGRWTAKDPILFAGGDTNLYGYSINDPINIVDPTGQIVPATVVAGTILGGIAGGVGAAIQGGDIATGVAVGAGTGALAGSLGIGTGLLGQTIANAAAGAIGSAFGQRVANPSGPLNFGAIAGSAIGSALGGLVPAGASVLGARLTLGEALGAGLSGAGIDLTGSLIGGSLGDNLNAPLCSQ